MAYKIAGIDVHKKMLAVVVADVEGEGDFQFERHKVGTSPAELRALAGWLHSRGRSISHKRSRIAGPSAARRTFRTPNVW